jgi:hypothetical protein
MFRTKYQSINPKLIDLWKYVDTSNFAGPTWRNSSPLNKTGWPGEVALQIKNEILTLCASDKASQFVARFGFFYAFFIDFCLVSSI